MFSGMPMSLRNATSTRMTSWEARRHDVAACYSTTYTWQRQMRVFFKRVRFVWKQDQRELLPWLWPLFDLQICGLSIDTLSAPNLSLSTSCRARAPLEECKSTWVRKTNVANVWRVLFTSRENSDRKFLRPSFFGLKRHHSERSWLVLQEATFLRASAGTTTNWNC